MMRTLLIACGNPIRRDDAVAAETLRLLAHDPDREMRAVHQLTPELAEEAARFDRVVFLDADTKAARVTIERLDLSRPYSPLTHSTTPAEIVALSRGLFAFSGEAFICRIPARDFSLSANLSGGDLSPGTLRFARLAAEALENAL